MEAWVNRIVANRCIDHIRKYRGNNVATPFVEMTPDDSDVEFEDITENENKGIHAGRIRGLWCNKKDYAGNSESVIRRAEIMCADVLL